MVLGPEERLCRRKIKLREAAGRKEEKIEEVGVQGMDPEWWPALTLQKSGSFVGSA